MVSISRQISQLLIDKQFELALRLCNLSTIDNTFQKYEKILEIQKLFAFYQVNKIPHSSSMHSTTLYSNVLFMNLVLQRAIQGSHGCVFQA